jgi:hypothetical protein
MGNRVIQIDKPENPLQKRRNPDTIGPDNTGIAGVAGKKGVGQDQFVPMAHTEKGIQQFRAYYRGNTYEHNSSLCIETANEEPRSKLLGIFVGVVF